MNIRKASRYLLIIFSFTQLVLLQACKNNDEQGPADSYLVDYQKKTSLSVTAIKSFLASYGMSDLDTLARYDITIYKITYYTKYKDNEIIASGVIAVPIQLKQDLPVIGAYRGTIFSQDEAPSNTPFISGYEIFSTFGFVTVIPDMIGFGSSDQFIHPYYNYEATAGCSADMIRAGQELMKKLNVTVSGKLFLFGYSEGGYIAEATQKAIESEPIPHLDLTAVATGAGSYDPEEVMHYIVSGTTFTSPSYLAFIVYAYKNYYGWNNPLSDFFNDPFAGEIPGLLDGMHSQSYINSQLNDTLEVLFRHTYLEKIRAGTETLLTSAFNKNRVDNWAPVVPVRIYHSPHDQYIPISDSENTVKKMKALGGNAEFVEIPGESHEEAGIEMVRVSVPWLTGLSGL